MWCERNPRIIGLHPLFPSARRRRTFSDHIHTRVLVSLDNYCQKWIQLLVFRNLGPECLGMSSEPHREKRGRRDSCRSASCLADDAAASSAATASCCRSESPTKSVGSSDSRSARSLWYGEYPPRCRYRFFL